MKRITHEGFSCEPESAGKSTANKFPTDFWAKFVEKFAENY